MLDNFNFFSSQQHNFEWKIGNLPFELSDFIFSDKIKDSILIQQLHRLHKQECIFHPYPKKQIKWINYENTYMQLCSEQNEGHIHSIKLINGNTYFEFEYDNCEIWTNYMRKYTINLNFQKNYVLVKKIGSGHFADVYQARNKQDGSLYAAKVFIKQKMKEQIDVQSLFKEIKIMRELDHPGNLKLFEIYETKNHICLITELLKGGDLHQYMDKKSPFSEEKTSILIHSLLSATQSFHSKRIMHRDLKPENIILKEKDQFQTACIADFGLADYYNQEGEYLFKRCGTPGYVAPELLQDKQYNEKVDLFSIGILMYTCLSGKIAFDGTYSEKVIKNYKGRIIDISKLQISQPASILLNALLNIDQDKRPTADEALKFEWFQEEKFLKTCTFKFKRNFLKLSQSPCSNKQSPLASPISSHSNFLYTPSTRNTHNLKNTNNNIIHIEITSPKDSPITNEMVSAEYQQQNQGKLINIHSNIYSPRKSMQNSNLPSIYNNEKTNKIRKSLFNVKY